MLARQLQAMIQEQRWTDAWFDEDKNEVTIRGKKH